LIALSTGSLYTYGISRVFALANHAGFDGVEVLVDHRWDSRDPAYLGHLSKEYKQPVLAVHSPFVPSVAGWPDDQYGRLLRSIELAKVLGAPVVVTHLPYRIAGVIADFFGLRTRRFLLPVPWPQRGRYYELLKDANQLRELEARENIIIAVENMPCQRLGRVRINIYWFNDPQILGLFPNLTLDTTHLGTWGFDPLEIYTRLREKIAHVHLSNFDGREHRLPQDGDLQLGELLDQIAQDGYQGTVTVEVDPSALRVESDAECLEDLARTVAFCRKHI
jgi:sugar phosphate isomerase/epimerase